MAISSPSRGLRPGVCTSTTRPANPYDGMVIYETDTNLVKVYEGAAWVTVGPQTPSGVVQVKSATKVDAFTTSSATFVDITDLTVSITPTAVSSKILALWQCTVGTASDATPLFNLVRDSTAISQSNFATNDASGIVRIRDSETVHAVVGMFLDSPSTTSATTYKIQCKTLSPAIHINRNANNTTYGGTSSITVLEVLA